MPRLVRLSAVALLAVLALAGAATPAAPAAQAASPAPSPAPSQRATSATPATASSTLRVGIKPLDPFVVQRGQGRYGGFSIELWNEIARRNNWSTTYVWHGGLSQLLDDVQAGSVDVGIAGISITKEREEVLDFSYPMFTAGLQVMSRPTGGSGWAAELSGFGTAGVGRYLLALVVVLVLAGNVVWLAGRVRARIDGRTGQRYLPGVGSGMYKAAGVGLVGDFGVGDPVRPVARFAAISWSIIGICFVSLFTAAVTTQLTVQSIRSDIAGVQDLPGHRVLTVEGTSAQRYLTEHEIPFRTVTTIDKAYPLLDSGEVDAIVFDAPVLQHRTAVSRGTAEVLVGGVFAHEDYGIAFPSASWLRKKVNTTLLEMQADGTYDRLYEYYFGNDVPR
ncbi:MAG TPA: transporter substrate-binding domain-containing protein [Kineosporiaceae bacterium]